jgi:hypothetical protein
MINRRNLINESLRHFRYKEGEKAKLNFSRKICFSFFGK